MQNHKHLVLKLAALSLGLTLLLAVLWVLQGEELFFAKMGWVPDETTYAYMNGYHVGLALCASCFAILVYSLLVPTLLKELRDKENTVFKAKAEHMHFAADVAHELRTPLAVMRAHLDCLEDQESAKQLSEDVTRMSRIVDQVMARNHIERLELSPNDVMDLSEIVGDVASYLAPLVIKEGRSIEVLNGDTPIFVNANAFAIDLALRNMVENAIRYSARGSTITIKILPDGDGVGQGLVGVQVIDRGQGVPEEKREVIFQRFQRADRRGDGTGLGLSIVRRVAEAHHGTISVGDTPGGGATFTMCLQKA
ncbi:HAMP domain-containing sensor histidine kinase [Magnetovibrio sp. PR-2]|uniref:sensor histidine kinase n=1 Tax=Magnetovibrio sp. PR-2 TaxID=3120356 RepID=UPI002FCE05EE